MTPLWPRVLAGLDSHGRVAVVTVAATRGSAPREAGARMIVNPGGGFTGTIGGGTLEWRAIAAAQAALTNSNGAGAEVRRYALGPELGQCCGGSVDLVIEVVGEDRRAEIAELALREAEGRLVTRGVIGREGVARHIVADDSLPAGTATLAGDVISEAFGDDRRPLILFGAGHIGRALVLALAPLPFAVTWVDSRPDAFPAHVPGNVALRQLADPATALTNAADGTFVAIMSHSHQLDLALVHAALSDTRFRYVGLVGSATKRARFETRLAQAGLDQPRIVELVCPIGIAGVRSKLPAAIAAATAAELLIRDEALRAAVAPVHLEDARWRRA
jgi:xanthine dehydrogenase accessory factor